MYTWTIDEPFGRDWGPEVVWRDLPGLGGLRPPLTAVIDGGRSRPAQIDDGRLAFVAELSAGARHRHEVMTATSATSTPSCTAPDLLQVDGDTATIAAPRVCTADVTAGLQLAWGSTPPSQSLLGLRRVDGSWAGAETGWSGATVEARDDEVLANGPVLARLRQTFNLCGGSTVRLTWEVDAASPAIRLDVEVIREVEGELILHLGHVCRPEQAYWRPHSPRSWRGGGRGGSHCRQIYQVPGDGSCAGCGEAADPPTTDELEIGPFYNWARDAASFWTCWGSSSASLLYVGWVRPSHTHLYGQLQRLRLRAARQPTAIDVHIPLQRGRRRLSMAVLDRGDLRMPTEGRGGDLDALHTRWNGLGLDDLQRMDLHSSARAKAPFPRMWLGQQDLAAVRSKLAAWPWLDERFAAHVDDVIPDSHGRPSHDRPGLDLRGKPGVLGLDAAGALLARGDDDRAAAALTQLTAQLDDMVELLLDYGPSVDGALGISLSRRWRALLIQLELVLGAPVTTEAQRTKILRQLAYVAEVQWSDDPEAAGFCRRGSVER